MSNASGGTLTNDAALTFTVKGAVSPNTGDTGVMYLWLFLMLLAAGGMTYIYLDRKA